MKCAIDQQLCIACGLCQTLAPHFFDYTDEGLVVFSDGTAVTVAHPILPQDIDNVTSAIKSCPTRALSARP